jgi:UDP-glucose 4-epimerase
VTRILVTGGQGLLGGAAARRFAEAGMEVVATQRGGSGALSGIDWFRADLLRPDALDGLEPPDAVVHTAAMLPRSHEASDAEAEANRQIDEAIFEAAQRWGASVVFTSSVAVYGSAVPPAAGLSEREPSRPVGAYAAEKAWAEERGRQLAAAEGSFFTSLRVSAPYGPEQRPMTVLRTFVERASRGEALLYWGSGARHQDFIHADDVAGACQAAFEHQGGGTFNVASGETVTMRELAQIIARVAGLPASAVQAAGTPDAGEGTRVAYSVAQGRGVLGWEPRISLPDGVSSWLARLRKEVPQ